jgi:hypothetical protein
MKLVLSGVIGNVGDRLPVRRPGGIPLVGVGRIREISWISLFHGNGNDFPTRREYGPGAVWRNVAIVQPFGDIHEPRTQLGQVAGNAHVHGLAPAGFQIEKI